MRVCAFDNGAHCPERCGLCQRRFADPKRSTTVNVQMTIDQQIDLFDPMPFRRKFAEALDISEAQIGIALSAGSTVVDMSIKTMSGTASAALALDTKIANTFSNPSVAQTVLGVPVLSFTASVASATPAPPPGVPNPSPPPPVPVPVASPLPPSEDDDSFSWTWIIVAIIVGVLVIGIAIVVYMRSRNSSRYPYGAYGLGASPPAVVVYAEHALYAALGGKSD